MKQAEILKGVLAGVPLVVVEYRAFKVDNITYADKKAGGMRVTKPIVKHSIELADTQASIAEWLPDGVNLADVKPSFKKGDKCVLRIEGVENVSGFASIKGKLEPFEAT